MGLDFLETSHNKIDQKKFDDNYKEIKWCKCNGKERCELCVDSKEEEEKN